MNKVGGIEINLTVCIICSWLHHLVYVCEAESPRASNARSVRGGSVGARCDVVWWHQFMAECRQQATRDSGNWHEWHQQSITLGVQPSTHQDHCQLLSLLQLLFPYPSFRRQQFDQEFLSVLLHFISPFQCICQELSILCSIVFICMFMSGLRLSDLNKETSYLLTYY